MRYSYPKYEIKYKWIDSKNECLVKFAVKYEIGFSRKKIAVEN